MKPEARCWLIGYLEGEATFQYHGGSSSISVRSTDQDVIKKAALLLKAQVRGPYAAQPPGRKPLYAFAVYGMPALYWMIQFFPAFSQHRQDQIEKVLSRWEHCL